MKFLLNMNLPRSLTHELRRMGHEARHVGDIAMAQASDKEVVTEAEKNGDTILTHDLDYGHLLAFSGRRKPSVVIFRVRDTGPDALFRRLVDQWKKMERALSEGAIVVLEDMAIRIRTLPIKADV